MSDPPGDLSGVSPEEIPAVPADEIPSDRPRSWLKVVARIAIGVSVVTILVVRTPRRHELVAAIREADTTWVAVATVTLFVGIVVSSFRWRAYLDALEIAMPQQTVLRLYFVGTFFNAFLPSGIGGDAYKAMRIGRIGGKLTPALASVFLDRFAGFVALAGVGFAGVMWEILGGEPDLRVAGVAFVLSLAMLSAAILLLAGGERLLGRGRVIKEEGIGGKVRGAVRAIHAAARHPPAAARGYAFGVLFQLLVLAYHVSISNALRLQGVSIGAMAGIVVIASLATMIPLSPGGLGFREAAYVWALSTFGVDRPEATAFALLVLAILLLTSAVGGVVYVVAGGEARRPKA